MSNVSPRNGNKGRAFTTDARSPLQAEVQPAPPITAVVVQQMDYGEDAGAGMEGIGQDEMLIPFVRILQANSAQCTEGSPAYDPAVRPGTLFNSATGDYHSKDQGFGFIPCARDVSFTEWVPIDAGGGGGGGFRGTWAHDDPRIPALRKAQGDFVALKLEGGTQLVETFTFTGLVIPIDYGGNWINDEASPGVVSFTSTQIKKYKMILNRLQSLVGRPAKAPIYAWRWVFGSQPEKNKKGSYYGWKARLAEDTANDSRMNKSEELFQMARELNLLIKSGGAKADFATSGTSTDAATSNSGGDPGHRGPTIDEGGEEIPF